MTEIQQKIERMDELAVRTLLKHAYQAPSQSDARMVTSSGAIHSIGTKDRESYCINAEHANTIIQQCQSRLGEIYRQRSALNQLVAHTLLCYLSKTQNTPIAVQHAVSR